MKTRTLLAIVELCGLRFEITIEMVAADRYQAYLGKSKLGYAATMADLIRRISERYAGNGLVWA